MNEIMELMLYYFIISILFQGFMTWTIINFNGKMTQLIIEALEESLI